WFNRTVLLHGYSDPGYDYSGYADRPLEESLCDPVDVRGHSGRSTGAEWCKLTEPDVYGRRIGRCLRDWLSGCTVCLRQYRLSDRSAWYWCWCCVCSWPYRCHAGSSHCRSVTDGRFRCCGGHYCCDPMYHHLCIMYAVPGESHQSVMFQDLKKPAFAGFFIFRI